MKCFYHDDADGHCAGFWVYLSAGVTDVNNAGVFGEQGCEQSFIPIQHGDVFPLGTIKEDEQVYIVDYSIPPELMLQLLDITENVIWIDHHASAIKKYKDFPKYIKGLRYDGISGCELTYAYLHEMGTERGATEENMKPFSPDMLDNCPLFTRLLGDRDTWTFAYGDDSKYFHEYYTLVGSPHPTNELWCDWLHAEDLTDELEHGNMIAQHSAALNKHAFTSYGYEAMFKGHKIAVCNSTNKTSELFGDLIDNYPFVSVYTHDGDKFKCSLYSTQMDVVDYAVELGGGGHPRACGFECTTLPFSKVQKE